MVLAVTVWGPLITMDPGYSLAMTIDNVSPESYIALGRQAAFKVQEQCIKEASESYISDKAEAMGVSVTAEISLNDNMEPYRAQLHAQDGAEQQKILEQVLEEDLGITKENQVWIWNQVKNRS